MKFCPVCGREYDDGKVCDADGAVLVQPRAVPIDSLIGQVLKESYRIEERIGEGGMAAVFRGVQITLERNVAIKVLMPGLQSTPSVIQRFFREARLLSQLSHPNIVGIIDFGHTEDGMVYMVMEYLIGATLDEIVPPVGGLDPARLVNFLHQICSGVASAHRRKLVHRDLKPDNIFVTQATGEESVKILDFGIARALEVEGQARLTQKGMLMGTPCFLAPEQIQSLDADARSDIYALGAILYFMATGKRPFSGDTPHAIFAQQVHRPPEIQDAEFGELLPFAEIVLRAMKIDPEERYQTATELAEAAEAMAVARGLIEEPSRSVATRTPTPAVRARKDEDLEPTAVMATVPSRDPDSQTSTRTDVEPTRMLRSEDREELDTPRPPRPTWLAWAALVLIVAVVALVLLL
ncbi:MAG: serine/threonine protein kinase [Thermoanaerobaculia bacterium]|nr:serine/threonine protein kinase [Thermoanaerobaculia bacterium]